MACREKKRLQLLSAPAYGIVSVQDQKPSATTNFISGAVASVAATLLTQPADVIRTHMQLNLARGTTRLGPMQTLLTVMNLGPAALFAGTAPRVRLHFVA